MTLFRNIGPLLHAACAALLLAGISGAAWPNTVRAQTTAVDSPAPATRFDADGSVHVSNLSVPPSEFASTEANAALAQSHANPGPPLPAITDIPAMRAYMDTRDRPTVARMRQIYPVTISSEIIGGVRTEIIEPVGGPNAANAHRVLINLHGGGFMWGEGLGGEVESIPIAGVGRIRVISVAYRMAPENRFPAASEDVAAVYRALLAHYRPNQIGIYGCSAGGILAAQAVAWFLSHSLPAPGAIGTFCGSAAPMTGDSLATMPALTATPVPPEPAWPYFAQVDANDPLAYPTKSQEVLARFPPTLLIAGSRDFMVSSLFYTQRQLTTAGVEAELHVWDGLPHAFFMDPDLPESREVYDVVARFFDRHLAR